MRFASFSLRNQAIWMLLLANLFWGLSFPLIKAVALTHERLLPGSDSWFITACTIAPRFILASALLVLWKGRSIHGITARELRHGVGLGLFACGGMLFQTDGLQFTAASTSAFLTQMYAISIPVYLALKTRLSPPWTVWISCILVLAGVAVLGRFDWRMLRLGRGESETLISSFFFMGQILWLERKEFAGNDVGRVTLIMFLIEAGAFSLLALATAPHVADLLVPWQSAPWLGFIGLLTLLCTIGAFMIMNTWQPKITATEAGLIYCVEPVFGSIMALFLPAIFSGWAAIHYSNESATSPLLIGGGLITAANLLIQAKPLSPVATAGQ